MSDAEKRENLEAMLESVYNLTNVTNLLLQVRQIEDLNSGIQYHKHPVDVRGVIAQVVKTAQFIAKNRGQTLAVVINDTDDVTVMADQEKLFSVVQNLVTNAIKYSPPQSKITITAHRGMTDVILSVTDQGQGISPNLQKKLFQKYERGEENRSLLSRTDDQLSFEVEALKSNGLGLVICKEYIENMGGAIGVHPAPSHKGGSTFWIQLPAAPPEEIPVASSPAGSAHNRSTR
jgi:signal transduction histidine kinase